MLAGTLDDKSVVVAFEPGLMSLADKDIDVIDATKDDEGNVLTDPKARFLKLRNIFKFLHTGTKYSAIYVDSLTEVSELMVQLLQAEFPDRKDSFPMWGEYNKRMREIIKGFRDLPYHVYMTSIIKPDKDQNNKRFMGFNIAGSIAETMPQYFNQVYYLMADANGKRELFTRATDVLPHARDRSKKLNPVEAPDLGAIARKILILEEKK